MAEDSGFSEGSPCPCACATRERMRWMSPFCAGAGSHSWHEAPMGPKILKDHAS